MIGSEDYGIHNDMKDVVGLAIFRVLSEDKSACRCPQCQSDMQCLILNRLTPQYRPVDQGNLESKEIRLEDLERDLFNQIMVESYRALHIVKNEPRHHVNRTFLHNSLEEVVLVALHDILRQEKRQLDYTSLSKVMAYVLNNLQPRYTTTNKGHVFSRTVEIDPGYLAKIYANIYNALGELQPKASSMS